MDKLSVVEIFSTMQGEGSLAGSPAVFLRLSGCNMWSGLEKHRTRGRGDCAMWCDTQFAQGMKMSVEHVVGRVCQLTQGWKQPLVVISGGEPMLQLKGEKGERLLDMLHEKGVRVALETNGTVTCDFLGKFDHITVSPKALNNDRASLEQVKIREGADLKVVMPQWSKSQLNEMSGWKFVHKFIQPKDDGKTGVHESSMASVDLASLLGWRVSLQTHKLVGLP